MVNFLIVATHQVWHDLYTCMLEVIHNNNNNVIMITNNGNTTQVLKSVGKDTSAISVDVFQIHAEGTIKL